MSVPTGTVTGTLYGPSGLPVAGEPVTARMDTPLAQTISPAGVTVPQEITVYSAADGTFSLPLIPNTNITPSNTVWAIDMPGQPTVNVSLVDTASHYIFSIATSTPAALVPAGQTVASLVISGTLSILGGILGPNPWYDVKAYGAVGNGTTDDSTAIQTAINTANTNGGGTVYFPPGTYIAAGLNIYGKIKYLAASLEGTILKLKNGSNTFLMQTNNFPALAAGGGGSGPGTSTGGETLFMLDSLTIDGNKANNGTAAVPLVRFYGYGWVMKDVHIRNGNHENFYSEWSTSLPSPGNDSMMAQIDNLKSHDAGRCGVHFNGPHDSQWDHGEIYNNNTSGQTGTAGAGMFVDAKGSGLTITDVHSWGLTQTYAGYLQATGSNAVGCTFEGAITAQVSLDANDVFLDGGFIYGAGTATPKGIEFGTTGVRQDILAVGVKINNCGSGALNFVNDGGCYVMADIFQTGGTLITGTVSSLTRLDIRTNGVAGGYSQFPGEVQIRSGNALKLYNGANSSFAALSFDGAQVRNTWPYQAEAGQFVASGAGIRPGTAAGAIQTGNIFMGSGVPSNANGNNGDVYLRTDTPGTAGQRYYIKSAGAWVATAL